MFFVKPGFFQPCLEQLGRQGGESCRSHPPPVAVGEHGAYRDRLHVGQVDLPRRLLAHVVEQHGAKHAGLAGQNGAVAFEGLALGSHLRGQRGDI